MAVASVTAVMVDGVEEPRAADGRVPGRRGRATRQRLLMETAEMLKARSYRDLKVVDIARAARTSPATFYQYFPDVESAVLVLAEQMAAQGPRLTSLIQGPNWRGRAGWDAAVGLVDGFMGFWEDHRSLLRVVDLMTEEGDPRFRGARVHLLHDVTAALRGVIQSFKDSGRHPMDLDAFATASVLVSMLAHVAAHRYGFEAWGIRTADVRLSMARTIYFDVTGSRPPKV
jgi:AcrR family transcriptional regulator